jgi:hypothetical protein
MAIVTWFFNNLFNNFIFLFYRLNLKQVLQDNHFSKQPLPNHYLSWSLKVCSVIYVNDVHMHWYAIYINCTYTLLFSVDEMFSVRCGNALFWIVNLIASMFPPSPVRLFILDLLPEHHSHGIIVWSQPSSFRDGNSTFRHVEMVLQFANCNLIIQHLASWWYVVIVTWLFNNFIFLFYRLNMKQILRESHFSKQPLPNHFCAGVLRYVVPYMWMMYNIGGPPSIQGHSTECPNFKKNFKKIVILINFIPFSSYLKFECPRFKVWMLKVELLGPPLCTYALIGYIYELYICTSL